MGIMFSCCASHMQQACAVCKMHHEPRMTCALHRRVRRPSLPSCSHMQRLRSTTCLGMLGARTWSALERTPPPHPSTNGEHQLTWNYLQSLTCTLRTVLHLRRECFLCKAASLRRCDKGQRMHVVSLEWALVACAACHPLTGQTPLRSPLLTMAVTLGTA